MNKNRFFVIALMAGVIGPIALSAAPPDCNGLLLSQLVAGGVDNSTGCAVQDLQFINWFWSDSGPGSVPDSANVSLADITDPGYPGANSINVGVALDSAWIDTPGGVQPFTLGYTVEVTDPTYEIEDWEELVRGVNLNTAGGGTGSVEITSESCPGGTSLPCPSPRFLVLDTTSDETGPFSADGAYNPTTNLLATQSEGVLIGGNDGAALGEVDEIYSEVAATPEPATQWLLGTGLALFLVLRRRLTIMGRYALPSGCATAGVCPKHR